MQVQEYDGRGLHLALRLYHGADYAWVIRWQAGLDLTGWSWWAGITHDGVSVELPVDTTGMIDGFVIVNMPHTLTAACGLTEAWGLWAYDPNGLLTPIVCGPAIVETPRTAP